MKSTRSPAATLCPYLGVDLSSRYATRPRPIDVCGLQPDPGGGLRATFWQWLWDAPGAPLELMEILREIRQARTVMVDGPQALASRGRRLRSSERLCRAPGKTPDRLPTDDVPYGSFIRSSVEWYAALHVAGVAISPLRGLGGVCEFYPGEGWIRLSQRRLPNKHSAVGRKVRLDLLRRFGVRFPRGPIPDHDALDACLGALMAAAADGIVPGVALVSVGVPLRHGQDGLREGPIMLPQLLPQLIQKKK